MELIKELSGHSGSKVSLFNDEGKIFVLKEGNVARNYERMTSLHSLISLPEIYFYDENIMKMEYIHGLDMKSYLHSNDIWSLVQFIDNTMIIFSEKTVDKDYTGVYNEALDWIDGVNELPFTKQELIYRLPKILPQSVYHGDMTLENILYTNKGFSFIDPVTVPYDSYIFDLAKLRQDLECKWFLRNSQDDLMLDIKLSNIQKTLIKKYPLANDDVLLILMLLRVYRHCIKDSIEHKFIIREVYRLWK